MTQELSDGPGDGLDDLRESGPVDFLVVELPTDRATGDAAFPYLVLEIPEPSTRLSAS